MRIDELKISNKIVKALISRGFISLYPSQVEAVPIALDGHNLVAAMPTASGKSLIGYISALKIILEGHKRVLYIVPLKSLASEKKYDFDMFSELGVRTYISTSDFDVEDNNMKNADIIVATSERVDSMIRHGSDYICNIGLVIVDEIHMIHDPERGPTLEVTLTKLIRRNRQTQIIALSATISNANDLAKWLNAKLVTSKWRPIPLREGVYLDYKIRFKDMHQIYVPNCGKPIWSLVKQTVVDGGQCIVFVNSRRSSESLAIDISKEMSKIVITRLVEYDIKPLGYECESTAIGKKLHICIKSGTAFHNAGLTNKQRRYVEDKFKEGFIKCIVATPTLAAGINLPARRVIIRDTTRFENNIVNSPMSVMEIKQMCGRAGRPRYDPYGESILIARDDLEYEHLMDDYINHDTERVTSKLFNDKTLRSHVLGLIATGDVESEESIIQFIRETFFGFMSGLIGIEKVIRDVVDFLEQENMIARDMGLIRVLKFGKCVSDLCIDPASASILRSAVMRIDDGTDDMQILIAAAMTPDVMGTYPKKNDENRLYNTTQKYKNKLLVYPNEINGYIYELFRNDLKTALIIEDWINEVPEETITDVMGIGPGDIRSKINIMDWIVYSMGKIALIFNPNAVDTVYRLVTRIKYGVKQELLDLIQFKGIGRVRARIIYNSGIHSRSDIVNVDKYTLSSVMKIGPIIANNLKKQSSFMIQSKQFIEKESTIKSIQIESVEDIESNNDDLGMDGEMSTKQASIFDF